jgi:hypothetical protein
VVPRSGGSSLLYLRRSSNSAVTVATSPDRKTPIGWRAMQKATVKEYMRSESLQMNSSLKMIEELFKLNEEELELNATGKELFVKMQELNARRDELAGRKPR